MVCVKAGMKYLILCLLVSATAVAQNTPAVQNNAGYRYSAKLYNNVTPVNKFRDIGMPPAVYQHSSSDFLRPSVAVSKYAKNGNIHELELAYLSVRRVSNKINWTDNFGRSYTIGGAEQTITNIALRYEYVFSLIKNRQSRLVPSVGIAAMPYYTHYRSVPFVTNSFPYTTSYIGAQFAAVPRLNIYTRKRIFFDINTPITFMNINYEHTVVNNPAVAPGRREQSMMNAGVTPLQWNIRLGLGVLI